MKNRSLKMAIKKIIIIAIIGFALTALVGCGIIQGPYRHGYNGRNYRNNADYNRSGYDYSDNLSATPEYDPENKGYDSMMGYGSGRSGYCRW
jgi:hypothetical protein